MMLLHPAIHPTQPNPLEPHPHPEGALQSLMTNGQIAYMSTMETAHIATII